MKLLLRRTLVRSDYSSAFTEAEKNTISFFALLPKVTTVQECDARGDATKNFCLAPYIPKL